MTTIEPSSHFYSASLEGGKLCGLVSLRGCLFKDVDLSAVDGKSRLSHCTFYQCTGLPAVAMTGHNLIYSPGPRESSFRITDHATLFELLDVNSKVEQEDPQ